MLQQFPFQKTKGVVMLKKIMSRTLGVFLVASSALAADQSELGKKIPKILADIQAQEVVINKLNNDLILNRTESGAETVAGVLAVVGGAYGVKISLADNQKSISENIIAKRGAIEKEAKLNSKITINGFDIVKESNRVIKGEPGYLSNTTTTSESLFGLNKDPQIAKFRMNYIGKNLLYSLLAVLGTYVTYDGLDRAILTSEDDQKIKSEIQKAQVQLEGLREIVRAATESK